VAGSNPYRTPHPTFDRAFPEVFWRLLKMPVGRRAEAGRHRVPVRRLAAARRPR
jgi:hypothetical protein